MKASEPCTECGGENKRAKSGLCGTCYARKWRAGLPEEKKKQLRYDVKKYAADMKKPVSIRP